MVIEQLTFTVMPDDRAQWLQVEEQTWSRFLERQPGFVRKEMWVEAGDEDHVHAVIWWESREQWKAVGTDAAQEVNDSMGEWLREPTMREYRVIRDA